MLDIVPRDAGDNPKARNSIAAGAVAALKKSRPSPLFIKDDLALIETGNMEDDLPRLKEADWVIDPTRTWGRSYRPRTFPTNFSAVKDEDIDAVKLEIKTTEAIIQTIATTRPPSVLGALSP